MSQCNATCDPSGCAGIPNGVMLLKKLDSMISDNYTLIFIWFVVSIILGLALSYFIASLNKNITSYYRGKNKVNIKTPHSNNIRAKEDDNYDYYETVNDDPVKIDINDSIPPNKKEFIKNLETTYNEYNNLKTEYLNKTYSGRKNDDIIDSNIEFKIYDNYDYKEDE
jgi:phosphate/sulfate permease